MKKSKFMFSALTIVFFIIGSVSIAESDTVLFDEFNGSASVGIVNGVTFTADTAVFDSADDGIEYPSDLFPAEGTMEVLLRVDQAGLYPGSGQYPPGSAILDSAGADARVKGDIFLVVRDTGIVVFTLAPVDGVNPGAQVQVTSTTSIIDGQFHSVAVSYGSEGIKLFIDCVLEDSDPFTGLRNINRPVSLADFTDRMFNDSSYQFGFIGEVEAIRTSTVQSDLILCPDATSIDAILTFFDERVADGTIYGRGKKPCLADHRLRSMREMLETAKCLIEADEIKAACNMLKSVFKHCDSEPRPRDSVDGDAVPELADRIFELMEELGCY